VRREFLCGEDRETGDSYEQCTQWIEDGLNELVAVRGQPDGLGGIVGVSIIADDTAEINALLQDSLPGRVTAGGRCEPLWYGTVFQQGAQLHHHDSGPQVRQVKGNRIKRCNADQTTPGKVPNPVPGPVLQPEGFQGVGFKVQQPGKSDPLMRVNGHLDLTVFARRGR
jgi:hypothetical protein